MTSWTTGTCEANGIDIHYLRTGGNKPPVVLLHGLMLNGACWTSLAQTLEKDYDVIMPDARGHGYFSAPNHGYYYGNLAADVISLIDALRLTTSVLLGHSMGGMTAAVVASQSPKQLRGLILADPTFRHRNDSGTRVMSLINIVKSSIDQKQITWAEARIRHSHRSREIIELFAQARFQTSIHAFEILTPPNPDYMQLINALDVPSLFVIGDTGSVVTTEMAAEFAGINQHLQITQIVDAGPAVPYDQLECFSAVVQTFLHRVSD